MAISTIFFDVGDVLFDENAQHQWLFHQLLLTLRTHGKPVFWDDFNAKRKALAALGPNPEAAIKATMAFYCANTSETEVLWQEAREQYHLMRKPRPYGQLLDGITPVLRDLKQDFKLGVLANQHPPVAQALIDYGIADLFEVIVISEIVHLYKPDPAIFHYAFDQGRVSNPKTPFSSATAPTTMSAPPKRWA